MTVFQPTRRGFLAGSGALVLGVALPAAGRAQSGAAAVIQADGPVAAVFSPNAFVRIDADDTVTVLIKHIEMGQGPMTGLSTLVAEELDADWGQMRATHAPADAELYVNALFGVQGTGGSTAMASSYDVMRQAGAAARAMLVAAAAEEWGVPAAEIEVAQGRVRHPGSGNESGFGALAEAASRQTPPQEPQLKDPADFALIGKGVPRLDSLQKSTGEAVFSLDVYREDMLTVAVLHPPLFGATLASVDPQPALDIPGVERVERIPSGVAVYGRDTFAALRGREALQPVWDESGAETRSSEQLYEIWSAAARAHGRVVEESGDPDAAFDGADRVIEAEYRFPFLAHAPMEPLDGVIELRDGAAEVWMGSQIQTIDHGVLAATLGMDQSAVTLNTMLAGGSFGRRAQPGSPFAAELASVATAAGPGAYKLMWTRENDIQGGWYRPLTVHLLRGALDAQGNITAWENRIANQSIIAGSAFEVMMEDGLDPTSFEGSTQMPYDLAAHRVSWTQTDSPVPILWWRSVGHTHTAYATETFLDELFAAADRDPVEGRLAMIKPEAGRDRAVLERVAEIAGWTGPEAGEGRRMGVALHESFNSYVAMIAEVVEQDGLPRATKVWCAVDCGVAVNPDVITAQMEGGIGFGLGAILFDEITLGAGGRPLQANFDTYRMLRINEMPEVEVSIVESSASPTGVGEPGVPPIGPAVANAWRAFGRPVPRRLPIRPVGAV